MPPKGDNMESITITWNWEDIQELKPEWGKELCVAFLENHGRTIIERSIEEGWTIIEDILTIVDGNPKDIKVKLTHLSGRWESYEVENESECRTQGARNVFNILMLTGKNEAISGLIKAEIIKENKDE